MRCPIQLSAHRGRRLIGTVLNSAGYARELCETCLGHVGTWLTPEIPEPRVCLTPEWVLPVRRPLALPDTAYPVRPWVKGSGPFY